MYGVAFGTAGRVEFLGTYRQPLEDGFTVHLPQLQLRATYKDGILDIPHDDLIYTVDILWEGEIPDEQWLPPLNLWQRNYETAIKWIENEKIKTRT